MEVEYSTNNSQQHLTLLKVLQNTNNIFGFEEIENLFNLINKRNPHYNILDYQFIEKNHENKNVIIIKIIDTQSSLEKSLKIYPKNLLDASEYVDLQELYKGQKQLLRDDLIVKIYDVYYLEKFKIPQYFVVEMECVDSSINIQILLESSINDMKSIMESALSYIDETMFIQRKKPMDLKDYQFYILYNEKKNSKQVKLNILQEDAFYYYNFIEQPHQKAQYNSDIKQKYFNMIQCQDIIDEEESLIDLENKLSKHLDYNLSNSRHNYDLNYDNNLYEEDSDYGPYFQEKDFQRFLSISKISQSELKVQKQDILSNNQIPKISLLSYIETRTQFILEKHPIEIFQILSQHPKYKYFSLVEYDDDYFIMKVFISSKSYYLKLQKFKNSNEADKVFQLYQKYYSAKNQDLFHPITIHEVLCGENHVYILTEEEEEDNNNTLLMEMKHTGCLKIISEDQRDIMNGFKSQYPYNYLYMTLHLMKSILRIYRSNLFYVNFEIKNTVFYNLVSNPKRIKLLNPLFLLKQDKKEDNPSKNDFLNRIKSLSTFFYNAKQMSDYGEFNICVDISNKFDYILNLLKQNDSNLEKQQYFKSQMKALNSCLRIIEQYQHILSQNYINSIFISDLWKLEIKPFQGQLVKTINNLGQVLVDTLEINKNDELHLIRKMQFPQIDHIKILRFYLQIIQDEAMNGLSTLVSLFPCVKEIYLYIEIQSNLSFDFLTLSQLNHLEVLDIKVKSNNKEVIEKCYEGLLKFLKIKNKFKTLGFKFDFEINQASQREWYQRFSDSKLNTLNQILNQQNPIELLEVTQFKMQSIQNEFNKLKSNLKIFLKSFQEYQQLQVLLSHLINEYEIECYAKSIQTEQNQLTLVFSHKSNQFEDLIVTLGYLQGKLQIKSFSKELDCIMLRYQANNFLQYLFEIIKRWWISENSASLDRKLLKEEFHQFHQQCICCRQVQQQVQLYKNQLELQNLHLQIRLCYHLQEQQISKDFYSFKNLVKLSSLYINFSTHELHRCLLSSHFYHSFKQLKSLQVLFLRFDPFTSLDEINQLINILKKLKTFVKFGYRI